MKTKNETQRNKKFITLAKKFKNNKNEVRSSLKGAFIHADFIHISDGFRIISFSDTNIECEKIGDDIRPINTISLYSNSDNLKSLTIDFDDVCLKHKDYRATKDAVKKNVKKYYNFYNSEDDIILTVNIQYLKDMVDLFNINKLTVKYSDAKSPLWFNDDNNKGLLLPVGL